MVRTTHTQPWPGAEQLSFSALKRTQNGHKFKGIEEKVWPFCTICVVRRVADITALGLSRMTRRKHLNVLSTASKCKLLEETGKKEIPQSFYLFRDREADIKTEEAIACTSYTPLWLSYFCNLTFPPFILSLLYLWFLLLTGVSTETAALSAPE